MPDGEKSNETNKVTRDTTDSHLIFKTDNTKKEQFLTGIFNVCARIPDDLANLADSAAALKATAKKYDPQEIKSVIVACDYLLRDRAKSQGGAAFHKLIKVIKLIFSALRDYKKNCSNINEIEANLRIELRRIDPKFCALLTKATPAIGAATTGGLFTAAATTGGFLAKCFTVLKIVTTTIAVTLGVSATVATAGVGAGVAAIGAGLGYLGARLWRHHKESVALRDLTHRLIINKCEKLGITLTHIKNLPQMDEKEQEIFLKLSDFYLTKTKTVQNSMNEIKNQDEYKSISDECYIYYNRPKDEIEQKLNSEDIEYLTEQKSSLGKEHKITGYDPSLMCT